MGNILGKGPPAPGSGAGLRSNPSSIGLGYWPGRASTGLRAGAAVRRPGFARRVLGKRDCLQSRKSDRRMETAFQKSKKPRLGERLGFSNLSHSLVTRRLAK